MSPESLTVMTLLYALFGVAVTIYSLVLNVRQAKVKDLIEITNQRLFEIKCLLEGKK